MVENNWRQAWLALRFFLIWGVVFGGLLGFISGALIFPLFGAILTVPWGLGIGTGLGLGVGLITGIVTLFVQVAPENVRKYRRRLSMAVGGLVTVAAPLLVHLTSPNILWFPAGFRDWNGDWIAGNVVFTAFWLPSIVAAALWGGLSAAYVAHRFAHYCALNVQEGMENAPHTPVIDHPNDIPIYWMGKFLSRWWLYPTMMIAGAIIHYQMQLTRFNLYDWADAPTLRDSLIGALAGGAYIVMASLLGAGNGLLLLFLNRITFVEYLGNISQQRYQRIVTAIAVAFTLTTGVLMAFGLLGPQAGSLIYMDTSVIALLAALVAAVVGAVTAGSIARSYSKRYFDVREKRKNASVSTIEDAMDGAGLGVEQTVILDSDGELVLHPLDALESANGRDRDGLAPGLLSG